MDVSAVAAVVGSFVVSERVIRAKAWVLAVLSSVVIYDLTQTSEDPWSLRVYRGPALIAFTISCVAASLRVWRRSGVACDELLFLPGTPYAANVHGVVRCPAAEAAAAEAAERAAEAEQAALATEQAIIYEECEEDDEDNHHLSSSSSKSLGLGGGEEAGMEMVPLHEEEEEEEEEDAQQRQDQHQQRQPQSPHIFALEGDAAAGIRRISVDFDVDQSADDGGGQQQQQQGQGLRSRHNTADDGEMGALVASGSGEGSVSLESVSSVRRAASASASPTAAADGGESLEEGFVSEEGNAADEARAASSSARNPDENKDESMIRYLLCSQSNRSRDLRRRRRGGGGGGVDDGSGGGKGAAEKGAASASSSSTTDDLSSDAASSSSSASLRRRLGRAVVKLVRSVSKSDTNDPTYSPSGPSVAGAALDLFLPVLFNFHMFFLMSQQASSSSRGVLDDDADDDDLDDDADDDDADDDNNDDDDNVAIAVGSGGGGDAAEPDAMNPRVLPLIFLSVLFFRSMFPPKARRRFWGTVKYTVCAPFYAVYFRDSFIGDVLTSLVRPIQDIVYCIFYYCVSVWSVFSAKAELDDAGNIMQHSWVLHNFALPACAALPLWWKFLQTLRQAHASGQHWPHLGNSFKYLSAALVIFYAMANPEGKRGKIWIACFLLTVLYQIWWDVVMDWELLVVVPRSWGGRGESQASQPRPPTESSRTYCCTISSIPGSSHVLLPIHRYAVQPVVAGWHRLYTHVMSHRLSLRPKRLYQREKFYWRIFAYNACFRFIWMLSFIPAYHFSTATGQEIPTLSIDFKTYVGAAISVAELIRRCLWCILKLELETIKVTGPEYSPLIPNESGHVPLSTMDEKFGDKSATSGMEFVVSALRFESQALMLKSSTSQRNKSSICNFSDASLKKAFFAELVMWAVAFVGLSIACVFYL